MPPPPASCGLFTARIAGDAGRPWLVFLHEGLGCTSLWGDFPQRLCAATGCRGLLYDRRGHGRSPAAAQPRTPGYLHAAALEELPAVLAAEIPGAAYVLVGHSDGGSIALIHAAQQPALLRGAVTVAAHVGVEDITLAGIRRAVAAWDAGKLAGLAAHHGDKTAALFGAWSETWLAPAFRDWNIEALLPQIRCPLLVVQGVDDPYGSPAQVDAVVRQTGGAASPLLLPACGHAPHRERTDALLASVCRFVTGLHE